MKNRTKKLDSIARFEQKKKKPTEREREKAKYQDKLQIYKSTNTMLLMHSKPRRTTKRLPHPPGDYLMRVLDTLIWVSFGAQIPGIFAIFKGLFVFI